MRQTFPPILAFLLMGTMASAATVTVTISADDIDIDYYTATVEDLPGPDGEVSLSEAIIATDHTVGRDTILFAIPQSDWIFQWQYPGRAVLSALTGLSWHAQDEVVIDARSQTNFTGNTNLAGGEVVLTGNDIVIGGGNSAIFGFDNTTIAAAGSNNLFMENSGNSNITQFGGSGSLIRNNIAGTIKLDRSNDNLVVGNTAQRVRVLGLSPEEPANGNVIGGPLRDDRNHLTGYGWVNGEGLPAGTVVEVQSAQETLIQNNWIGTDLDGMSQGNAAATIGVALSYSSHIELKDNLIAGIQAQGQYPHYSGQLFGTAIYFGASCNHITIQGNTIGLNAEGQPLLGSVTGIEIGYLAGEYSSLIIGGDLEGQGNTIAGHILNGILAGPGVLSAQIRGNAIYDNGQLGIDLIPTAYGYGVTPNDAQDTDTGANGLLNFPTLGSALSTGTSLSIAGSYSGAPLTSLILDFFASPYCDDSGYGEGQEFLGSRGITTDSQGNASFDVSLLCSVQEGWFITATASLAPAGGSSEFSACLAAEAGGLAPVNDLRIQVWADQVQLSWSATQEASSYRVEKRTSMSEPWYPLGTSQETSWTDAFTESHAQYRVIVIQ